VDHFSKLKRQIQARILLGMLLTATVAVATFGVLYASYGINVIQASAAALVATLITSLIVSNLVSSKVLEPLQTVWHAVLHIDPEHHGTAAPDLSKLRLGRELVTNLVLQVYQFASQQNSKELVEHRREISQAVNIVDHLPLPLFVFNKDLLVTNASNMAMTYCGLESSELFGKSLFDNLRLEFPSEHTLDAWVTECQDNKATDTAYWERVHVLSKEDNSLIKQCDIAAYYNRDNPSGTEFIVTLFDRTEKYGQDDNALGFVALAVHELRTPITMLRGYIEVFEDELSGQLNEELQSFMLNMDASAKHLSSFVSNILNVARIDQNELALHLTEESWADVLKSSVSDAELRAKIHGKVVEYEIDNNLPKVAVDQVSIYEVLNNLLENAIKYSGESKRILVRSSLNKEGMIETTIQDFGAGIPASVLPTLFEKFSRNHRTKSQVSGTGLGLYLTKALITAHGGQVWASSKEGEGSTFGFTLQPYTNLAKELKDSSNKEITRNAHGWIKNHSLYRR
jgi:signal transduction histidine kinase